MRPNRRELMRTAAAASTISGLGLSAQGEPNPAPQGEGKPRMKVAALCSTYFYLSHAYHIVGRFLDGFPLYDGKSDLHRPSNDFEIASMYIEQVAPETDLGLGVAARHKIPVFDSVEKALTLGSGKLAVDAVLLIAEHGKYKINEKLQTLYPRHDYFSKMVGVFRESGRAVPVFVDKHLSYDRAKAAEMIAWSQELKFPLMAGSSLPITWRRPDLEIPVGAKIDDVVVLSRGEIEIFGFHALETLQCFVERRDRRGAKQGVKAVTCLTGDDVWKAAEAGRWSMELLEAAASRSQSRNVGGPKQCTAEFSPPPNRPTFLRTPLYFEVEYADGFIGKVVTANGYVDDTTIALNWNGHDPAVVSTNVYLPAPPGASFFNPLVLRIEETFRNGQPPYSPVRSQLTGGVMDALLESRLAGGKRIVTPDLENLDYEPPRDSGYIRTPWPDQA